MSWKEFILRVNYKPGFVLELIEETKAGAHVHIKTPAMQDSRIPENTEAVFIQEFDLPPYNEKTAVKDFRDKFLLAYEAHELDEWYLVDGERVGDPHKGVPLPRCFEPDKVADHSEATGE